MRQVNSEGLSLTKRNSQTNKVFGNVDIYIPYSNNFNICKCEFRTLQSTIFAKMKHFVVECFEKKRFGNLVTLSSSLLNCVH